MLNELFTFPIVMIDGDNEERKIKNKEQDELLGLKRAEEQEDETYDIVFGEAEYPYWDFIGVEDRWLPSKESLEQALKGNFDACIVRFLHAGQLLVPWSKGKFKKELKKFAQAYELANPVREKKPEVRIMALTADQFKKQMEDGTKSEE